MTNYYDKHRKFEYYLVKKMLYKEKLGNIAAGVEGISYTMSESYDSESNSNFNFYKKQK